MLDKCHKQRNLAEYEGFLEIDDGLLDALIVAAEWLQRRVAELPPIRN
ncbi:hypothetical protein [Crenobacter cavernae]|nr:hypothetical protein [Crenobacter cavernae]